MPDLDELLPPWPDEAFGDAARRIGRACFSLLFEETRWVHRRVEKFSVLSPELFHRSVTVDFTVPELFRSSLALPDDQWAVPLATLPKQVLRNFDLRDETGRALPVLGMESNGLVAEHALRTAEWFARDGDPDAIPPRLEECLETVSSGDPFEAEQAIDRLLAAEKEGDQAVRVFLADDRASSLLGELANRYLLFAVVTDLNKRRILKYSYEFPLTWEEERPSIWQRLGWESLRFETDVPAAAHTASYHAEVIVPEELRIDGSFIYDEKAPTLYALEGEADRASLHAPRVPLDARPLLLFAVRPERPGFPTVAAASSWVTASIVFVGGWFGDLSLDTAPGAALSLLLAGSALFSGAVARGGEHQLVRTLFFWPRVLLVLNALAGLAAGAALGLGFCESAVEMTWKIAGFLAVLLACILSITLYRAARPRR